MDFSAIFSMVLMLGVVYLVKIVIDVAQGNMSMGEVLSTWSRIQTAGKVIMTVLSKMWTVAERFFDSIVSMFTSSAK